jgi:hypothetical protein
MLDNLTICQCDNVPMSQIIKHTNIIFKCSNVRTLSIFTFCFFSLVLSITTKAQTSFLEKPFSAKYVDVPLKDILNDITEKTNIRFSYSPKKIPEDSKITISFSQTPLYDVLDQILINLPVKYEVIDNYIVLKKNAEDVSEIIADVIKKITFSGYIKDKESSEFLLGAIIYLKDLNLATTTNNYGFFSLTVPQGKHDLEISYIGYERMYRNIDLKSNYKADFSLSFRPQKMEEIIISSLQEEEINFKMRASHSRLLPSFVEHKPSLMGESDVIKSLAFQPGIVFYGDGSSYFHVRGGNYDQNLIILDEATIFNPSHLLGIFSPIIPDAIKSVDIYKADYPVNYGGRLSSVIDITTKDGNKNKFSGSGCFGLISARGTFEGPIKKDASSYFLSFRRSYFDAYIKPFNPSLKGLYFYDFTTKVNIKMGPKNRLFLTVYNGKDVLRTKVNGNDQNGINWGNTCFSSRWNHVFGSRVFMNSSFYASQYKYYLYSSVNNKEYWNSRISNVCLKEELTFYATPKTTWRYGLKLATYGFNPGNYVSPSNENNVQVSPVNSSEIIIFGGSEKELFPWLRLNYGLRLTTWQNSGEAFVIQYDSAHNQTGIKYFKKNENYYRHWSLEPRLSASVKTGTASSLKASYSRTNQFINLITNSVSPFNSLEVWLPAGPNIKPQYADIVDLGYVQSFSFLNLNLQTDVFYKWMYNQIGYKYHANMLVNPAIEGELRQGEGWSYGFEVALKKEGRKLSGQINYTYSRSFLKINELNDNKTFPAVYDRPHNFNISIAWQPCYRWLFTTDYCLASGSRFTSPTSFYYYRGYQVPVYAKQNNDQMPMYKRIDIAITLQLNKPNRAFNHSLSFAIINLLNQKNPIFMYFNKHENEYGDPVIPADRMNPQNLISTIRYTYGIIPSFNYQFRF